MKFALTAAAFLTFIVAASADSGRPKLRFANAATDACVANCSTQAASCRRACPATFSTPCLTACDNQAETCARSCRAK
jgi:hypothetical protein